MKTFLCLLFLLIAFSGIALGNEEAVKSPAIRNADFLMSMQNADGSWGADEKTRPVLTALVLLGFTEYSLNHERYGSGIVKGLKYLTALSDEKVEHPIIVNCLCDFYVYTKISHLKDKALKGYKRIISLQEESGKFNCNLSYFKIIEEDDKKDSLLSQAWCLSAAISGFQAFGEMNEDFTSVIKKSIKYISKKYSKSDGTYSFLPGGESSVEATGVGIYLEARCNGSEVSLESLKKVLEGSVDLNKLKIEQSRYPSLTLLYFNYDYFYTGNFGSRPLLPPILKRNDWHSNWRDKYEEATEKYDPDKPSYAKSQEVPSLDEKDKKIFYSAMILLSGLPIRSLPTFKIKSISEPDNNAEKTDLKIE